MDPRRLLTFREVARRRSFSRAGEELALTQPAVSQQVSSLERQLGVRLLDRGPGGPTPTEAGALLLAHADAIADRLAQAGAQVAELAAAERETLRVGAFPSALASVIPAAIARLREQLPEVQVEAAEGSGEELGRGGRGRHAARGDVLPGRRGRAAPARGDRAPRAGRRGDAGRAAARPPLAGRERLRLGELAERDVDGAVARPPDLPRLRGGRLRAADQLRHARRAGGARPRAQRARRHARARAGRRSCSTTWRSCRSRARSRGARCTRSRPRRARARRRSPSWPTSAPDAGSSPPTPTPRREAPCSARCWRPRS